MVGTAIAPLISSPSAQANGVPFAAGDVLADVGGGIIKEFSPGGALLDTLDTTTGTHEGDGMCFDAAGDLYATQGFTANTISKFSIDGELLAAEFGSGYNEHPESCVFDSAGHMYVGEPDGAKSLLKFDAGGNLLNSFTPETEGRGVDWIDLAPDQCTLRYTSEGSAVKAFNVCTNVQLPDFATALPAPCYAQRILPDGGDLVACESKVVRLDSSGVIVQEYEPEPGGFLFGLTLDSDGTTFWTGGYVSGEVYRIDIATGAVLSSFSTEALGPLGGLATVQTSASSASRCATTAIEGEPSPEQRPSARTPRFSQPGTRVVLAPPSGEQFCGVPWPYLGGAPAGSLEELTPTKLAFRVPPEAASGLTLAPSLGGEPRAAVTPAYYVDNFRYPWGFAITNYPGDGNGTYDGHIGVTQSDLDSVFGDLGGPRSPAYEWAKRQAEWTLRNGLCYGFSLLSWNLYGDAEREVHPLGWASSTGLALRAASEAYHESESTTGAHALTHALMRAAVSQFSPEAEGTFTTSHSASQVRTLLDSAFGRHEPAMLLIHWIHKTVIHNKPFWPFSETVEEGFGHALLAYDYQSTSDGGVAVDVVDPDLPWAPGHAPSEYRTLQVHVAPGGGWTFTGGLGMEVGGASGSLQVVANPRVPGDLNTPWQLHIPWVTLAPSAGSYVTGVGYSGGRARAIPGDAVHRVLFYDGPDNELLVPSNHRTITAAIYSPSAPTGNTDLIGSTFLDAADLGANQHTVMVRSDTGAITVPRATAGTRLGVTRIVRGTQYAVDARFTGEVSKATISVGDSGQVSVTTAGGDGRVSLGLASYASGGEWAKARPVTVALRGHARIRRHTPHVRRRHKHCSRRANCSLRRRSKHRHHG